MSTVQTVLLISRTSRQCMVATKWSLVDCSGQPLEQSVDQNTEMLIYSSSTMNRNRRQLLKCSPV